MQYLIGYDIADPKRLQRIYRRMTNYATPIQYSIFLFEGSEKLLTQCLTDIRRIFHPKEDDLRVYPLPHNGSQWCLGKASLPQGIIWTALPMSLTL
ncbi:CRISPR-associated endonuclease Cas2 [Aggregatibacter kilianii]|uniref:CRISPR-associated endonuclease Cas2 n=1 Tax=Aggregatibacter kilianii TaxID=2025884 RepID=UPI0028F08723|nr:CRISPR-associated endonuclease Cas2 [Aggregatibacter kilianii]